MKIIIPVIVLFFFFSCAKEDSPFAPRSSESVDYSFTVTPTEVNRIVYQSSTNYAVESAVYCKSPLVITYQVATSADGNSWGIYNERYIDGMNMGDSSDPANPNMRNDGNTFLYSIREKKNHTFSPATTQPVLTNQKVTVLGTESQFSFNYPVILLTVKYSYTPINYFIERFYKISAVDFYGGIASSKIFSFKFCRMEAMFKCVQTGQTIGGGAGQVLAYSGNIYTVQIKFSYWGLNELWKNMQSGNTYYLYSIYLSDLNDKGASFTAGTDFANNIFLNITKEE